MSKKSALELYEAKLAEAEKYADSASEEMRDQAKALVAELKALAGDYLALTGKELPEYAKLAGEGARAGRGTSKREASGSGRKRTRQKLSGKYAGMTIPEAIHDAVGAGKAGMGPQDIAKKIGGKKQSVAVAIASMVKDGRLRRVSRGLYARA